MQTTYHVMPVASPTQEIPAEIISKLSYKKYTSLIKYTFNLRKLTAWKQVNNTYSSKYLPQ